MHIGFTGTQEGMTPRQVNDLYDQLNSYYSREELDILHHGDCIGADEQAHSVAWDTCYDIIIHPPENTSKRAYCPGYLHMYEPKPYLDRNKDIVDACDVLIAAPKGPEELRSGTWSTVRYARKVGKPIVLLESYEN